MRNWFRKEKWDPYMDGIEIRPRLHTWPEKIIFLISMLLILASLLLLILPSRTKGYYDAGEERFWQLTQTRELEDQTVERIIEGNSTVYRLNGPFAVNDDKRYVERWVLDATLADGKLHQIAIFLGPENSSAQTRSISFQEGDKTYEGNWLAGGSQRNQGRRGRLVSLGDDPFFYQMDMIAGGVYYLSPDYELISRMVLESPTTRKAAMWRFLGFTILAAGISALLTYIYNETFILQRALLAISYHRSEDVEPTGLYSAGHFIGTALVAVLAVIFFFMYFH